MRTTQLSVDKAQFMEFLEHACKEGWSLNFSMDTERRVWPSYGRGWSEIDEREYVGDGPWLLNCVTERHADERPEGGRFRINFQGAYSHEANRYFILFSKSKDLIMYERSFPPKSGTPLKALDFYVMKAKAWDL